jgi:outer membrane protein OmpA-like peptidoglycan-associated protein
LPAGLAAAGCAVLLCGCAATERVVLLPDEDGRTGTVVVEGRGGDGTLSEAWAEARMAGAGRVTQRPRDRAGVESEFAATLSALPADPRQFTLYFVGDSDTLTDASAADARAVLAEIARLPHAEVVAIGHTDSTGDTAYNDALSLARARVVRDMLVGLGVAGERIAIAGRGEREPVVATPDETAEPRNRRVEINVR